MITLAPFHDPYFVYACILRLYGVYLLLTSLEYLSLYEHFTDNGVFSWKIMRTGMHPAIANTNLGGLFHAKGISLIILVRLVISLYFLMAPFYAIPAWTIVILVTTTLLLSIRCRLGNDGTDQMSKIIGITLLISFTSHDPAITTLGLYFIAVQAILAYVIAGAAKLLSPKWRSGLAVFQIMNTETFGYRSIAGWLHRAPHLVRFLLSWNIMLFETFFFLAVFLPAPWCYILLCWGLLFHLFNAIVMGLNHFFWIFLATYPAVLYLNTVLHH